MPARRPDNIEATHHITARLPRDTVDQLDRWANDHGVTRSHALWRLLTAALDAEAAA